MGVTQDELLGGRLRLTQPSDGYRAGMDAALLAAACDAGAGATVIEAGCGVGAVLLAAALRRPQSRFVGVENDPVALGMARDNIAANDLGDRVGVVEGDISLSFAPLGLQPFDAALANPPFFDSANALRGPAPAKVRAWITEDGLASWIGFLVKSVRQGGTITLVHRADRLGDILGALAPKAGSVQVRAVHPFADEPAKRVLVRAIKTGKGPLRILPPLILHQRDGSKHATRTERILRGEASVDWL